MYIVRPPADSEELDALRRCNLTLIRRSMIPQHSTQPDSHLAWQNRACQDATKREAIPSAGDRALGKLSLSDIVEIPGMQTARRSFHATEMAPESDDGVLPGEPRADKHDAPSLHDRQQLEALASECYLSTLSRHLVAKRLTRETFDRTSCARDIPPLRKLRPEIDDSPLHRLYPARIAAPGARSSELGDRNRWPGRRLHSTDQDGKAKFMPHPSESANETYGPASKLRCAMRRIVLNTS